MNELLGTNLFAGATYVLIATSALVCLVAFFGCLGAGKEVKCMLLTVSTQMPFFQLLISYYNLFILHPNTISVLHHNFPDLCDDADRRHTWLCVPRESGPNDAPGNAFVAQVVRQPTINHPSLGSDSDASQVLRR